MSAGNHKILKEFVDIGFGFPVRLRNVPMVKIDGVWTPNINYNTLAQQLLVALAHKPTRLTGSEIRFIRLQSEMTLAQFGARFGVTHPCVSKWEDFADKPTNMSWPTEKDIRLFVAQSKENDKRFLKLYQDLEIVPKSRQYINELNAQKLAA